LAREKLKCILLRYFYDGSVSGNHGNHRNEAKSHTCNFWQICVILAGHNERSDLYPYSQIYTPLGVVKINRLLIAS